jgi:hypothetical protein
MSNRYGYFPTVLHNIGPNGRTIPIDDANPLHVTSTPSSSEPVTPEDFVNLYGSLGLGGTNYDASGRSRVSQLLTLGDYKAINDQLPLFYDTQGTGTHTYTKTNSYFNMSVTAGQWLVKQSKMFHNYASGKSQLVEMTFINFMPEDDVTKRVGYYSSNSVSPYDAEYDGIYLESSAGTVKLKIDRLGVNIATIEQANWLDPMDGTGPSKINIDWANFNVGVIDFLWLGGTSIRLFFFTEGRLALAHTYIHSNRNAFTVIQSPNQPVRSEIRSTGGTGTFIHVCCQVSSEGSVGDAGLILSTNNGNTHLDANTVGTRYALLGFRLKSAYRNVSINPISLRLFSLTADRFLWEIRMNPVVAGTFTYADVTNSAAQTAWGTTANTVSGGTLVDSGLAAQQTTIDAVVSSALRLGSTLGGVMDQYVLTVMPFTANMDILGTFTRAYVSLASNVMLMLI